MEKIKKLITKLDERELSQIDIFTILAISNNDEKVIDKLINYVDNTNNKTKPELISDLLELATHSMTKKSVNKDTYKIKNKHDNGIYNSVHTATYEKESDLDQLLNVTYSLSNVGHLRVLGPSTKLNYFCVELNLAYMDLLELENNTRESFRKIDLYKFDGDKINYSFQPVIDQLNNDIDNYKHIIIWTKHNNTNAYLLPYYFINKFYEKIKEKKILLIYTDELPGCKDLDQLKLGQFQELIETGQVLTKEEIDNYSNEWNKIVSHNCDIRNLVNGKLEYKNIEDYYDIIKELLKKEGKISRTEFICKLMNKNILCGGIADIYSYIIDNMIKENIISSKDYKVPCFIPADKISLQNEQLN